MSACPFDSIQVLETNNEIVGGDLLKLARERDVGTIIEDF